MRVIEACEDSGFVEIGFDIFRTRNSISIWHLDGDGTLEVFVVSQVNVSESTLTQQSDHSVSPNLLRHTKKIRDGLSQFRNLGFRAWIFVGDFGFCYIVAHDQSRTEPQPYLQGLREKFTITETWHKVLLFGCSRASILRPNDRAKLDMFVNQLIHERSSQTSLEKLRSVT